MFTLPMKVEEKTQLERTNFAGQKGDQKNSVGSESTVQADFSRYSKNQKFRFLRDKNKKILKNVFSLSGVQLANYAFPLITVPYVVRVIGPEKYGIINFAQAFVGYFTLIINYGFDLTATREIAKSKNSPQELSRVFWNVIWAKLLLFVISTGFFTSALLLSQRLQLDPRLYVLTYLVNVGFIFFPTWFFQGIEELTKTALFDFITRLIFTGLIFILIRQASDYYYFPVCISVGQVSVGVAAFSYAIRTKRLFFFPLRMKEVIRVAKDGLPVFVSTVVVNFYTLSNIVVLGFMATDLEVGLFSSAYKVISIILVLAIVPVTQTLYPHVGGFFAGNPSKEDKSLRLLEIVIVLGSVSFLVSLGTLLLAPLAVHVLFGNKFSMAVPVLRTLAFIPFIIGLSNVFGVQGMLNLKLDKAFLAITSLGALVCVVLNVLFVPIFRQQGTAFAWVITELLVTATTYLILWKNGYPLFTRSNFRRVIGRLYV